MKTRIYFLDNLRVFIIFLVIVLHSAIAYTPFLSSVWIVDDPAKSSALGYLVIFLDLSVMFTMFYISGYFVPGSLKRRSLFSFISAKFRRIMIPWIVAVFTLIPAYKFIFLYSRGLPQQEWYTYFHMFTREGGNMAFFADNPTQSWLWFLPVLFLFQVVYALLSKTGLLKIRIRMGMAVSLAFTLSLVSALFVFAAELNGWFTSSILHFQRERLLAYFLFFLLGSLSYKLKVFETSRRNIAADILSPLLLVISLVSFKMFSDNYFTNLLNPERGQFLISEAADGVLYFTSILVSVFTTLYVLLRIFRKFLNRSGSLASEMSRNSYAVYIIHMVVMGALSLPLLHAAWPAWIKFTIVTMATFMFSNMIISGGRTITAKVLSCASLRYAAVLGAAVISIVVYSSMGSPESTTLEQDTRIPAPQKSIHMASISGDTATVRLHILAGTDIDLAESSAASSPLISASLFGRTEVVKMLLDAGADVNYQNKDGSTALHTAAFFCHADIVELLLEGGAAREIRNTDGSTALESVLAPWEIVQGIYEYFNNTLGPLGLEIDYKHLKDSRPTIATMLQQ